LADNAKQAQAATNVAEYTVSQLALSIKRALEDGFGYVKLRGEISGYRGPHSSGHCYFSLKDDKSRIDAVIWRHAFNRLRLKPEEGMEVIAQGKISSFPGASKYQIVVETMEPAGVGALMALLEERKRKFAAEGLFANERKKPIPFLPRVIGVVTSPTGAVIRDILAGFNERFPAHVIVWPVRVQGETSAAEVASAVRGFNALPIAGGRVARPDTVIVARGGGSLEDLWSFNEDAVVRAVADSDIPVIAAVGHETDWTLIDLVADARAPTPTKAAEWTVPKYTDLAASVEGLESRLKTGVRRTLETARTYLKAAARGLPKLPDLLVLPRQRFDAVERRLSRALQANTAAHDRRFAALSARLQRSLVAGRVERAREQLGVRADRLTRALANRLDVHRRHLAGQAQLLRSLSYQSVLERGFALVKDDADLPVRRADDIAHGQRLVLQFGDGARAATATSAEPTKATDRHDGPERNPLPQSAASSGPESEAAAESAAQSAAPARPGIKRSGVKKTSASAQRANQGRQGSLF